MTDLCAVRLLAFDTFGTVVDWFGGICAAFDRVLAPDVAGGVSSAELARHWRSGYAPALAAIEAGQMPWRPLDDVHRGTLADTLRVHGLRATPEQTDELVHSWHTLPAWPDSVEGLTRLRRGRPISALSNGGVALLVEMARNTGLPWDFVGGSDLWRHYKPAPEVYLGLARVFGLEPHEVMMVAAHQADLDAAAALGLRTAYVERPLEWGRPTPDADAGRADVCARDLLDLADRLDS